MPAVIQKKEDQQKKKDGENYPVLHRHKLPGKSLSVIDPHAPNEKEVKAVRLHEDSAVKKQIAEINRDSAAVINPHSIKALQHIKPHQLQTASRDIDNNRNQIIDVVGQRVQEHPQLFNRGLTAMDKVFQGARKLKPKDMQAGKRVLTQVAIAALLGTSVLALTMGAAPLAVVSARILWDVWMHDKESKKKDKDGDEKDVTPGANDKVGKKALLGTDRLGNKIHQDKMREQGFEWDDEKGWNKAPDEDDQESDQISAEDFVKEGRKKAKGGKSKEVQPRKPKKQKHWTEEDSEDAEFTTAKSKEPFQLNDQHTKTINTILDQLSDVLKYQSPEELNDLSGKMFGKANSVDASDLAMDVYNAVAKLAEGRLAGVPGAMFYGMFRVNIQELAEITERVCNVAPEVEIENGQKCFHFATDRGLVTLGVRFDREEIQFMITEAQ